MAQLPLEPQLGAMLVPTSSRVGWCQPSTPRVETSPASESTRPVAAPRAAAGGHVRADLKSCVVPTSHYTYGRRSRPAPFRLEVSSSSPIPPSITIHRVSIRWGPSPPVANRNGTAAAPRRATPVSAEEVSSPPCQCAPRRLSGGPCELTQMASPPCFVWRPCETWQLRCMHLFVLVRTSGGGGGGGVCRRSCYARCAALGANGLHGVSHQGAGGVCRSSKCSSRRSSRIGGGCS